MSFVDGGIALRRDMHGIDKDRLIADALSIDWRRMICEVDVDAEIYTKILGFRKFSQNFEVCSLIR